MSEVILRVILRYVLDIGSFSFASCMEILLQYSVRWKRERIFVAGENNRGFRNLYEYTKVQK